VPLTHEYFEGYGLSTHLVGNFMSVKIHSVELEIDHLIDDKYKTAVEMFCDKILQAYLILNTCR
jgi:hypothetical protein